MKEILLSVQRAFRLQGEITDFHLLTEGSIHITCLVHLNTGKNYIFQQMNTHVFRNPEDVMQNIRRTAEYLHFHFPERKILHFYQTPSGSYFFQGWRVMDAVSGRSLKSCENLYQVQKAGEAFGRFQKEVSGMNAGMLKQVIPDFHHTRVYFQKLLSLHSDLPEFRILKEWQEQACYVCDVYQKNQIPLRVTHNDMKCSNLLFDSETGQPSAVIDWDTIMPGMAVYDFGDAVRSFASDTSSSEPDLSKVGMNMTKFKAFSSGWLSQTDYTPKERELLIPSVFSVTVELAVRYLTDYLQGNLYFKTSYPEQNLIRTRNQIRLAQKILKQESEMKKLIF